MGVPGLASWVNSNCRSESFERHPNVQLDSYSIDMNAVIHSVSQEMEHDDTIGSHNEYCKELVNNVIDKLIFLVRMMKPRKHFFVCIDGVAGVSKSIQQRGRRFRSAIENKGKKIFDSNAISVGTPLMKDLTNEMENKLRPILKKEFPSLTFEVSSYDEAGEGEHKIMKKLNKLIKEGVKSICIHSPDNDLFFLCLLLIARHEKIDNLVILRYNSDEEAFDLYDIIKLAMIILGRINSINKSHLIDFVAIASFLGNDFMPAVPTFEVLKSGMEELIQNLREAITVHGGIIYHNEENGIYGFNKFALHDLIRHFALQEGAMLYERQKRLRKILMNRERIRKEGDHTDRCMKREFLNDYDKTVDVNPYKQCYYQRHFEKDVHKMNIVKKYLTGSLYVLNCYMTSEVPSWNWFYPFHHAPFFSDMEKFMDIIVNNYEATNLVRYFTKGEPRTVIEQLLCTLPRSSVSLLPEQYKKIMMSPKLDPYFIKPIISFEGIITYVPIVKIPILTTEIVRELM